MIPSPRKGFIPKDERGAALVSAVLILLLLTVLATGGYWLSRGELAAAQGYSQSVRAFYLANAGIARYFAANPAPSVSEMTFEYYDDPCLDTIAYPSVPARNLCYELGDNEEEELLEEFQIGAPPALSYAFANADVYLTARFLMTDGMVPIYEVTAEARVQDGFNPDLWTARAVTRYAELSPPFSINSVFAATGGINFAGDNDDHYHFDGSAAAGKTGSCGSEVDLTNIELPSGEFDLPIPNAACPGGKECPYKWHQKGTGTQVDSSYVVGSAIIQNMGLDWSDFLNGDYFTGIPDVVSFDDSNAFEDYFDPSKDKAFKSAASWPITRFDGDLSTTERVKGYGFLIVDGDVTVVADKLEWTGVILVGGTINTLDGAHIHVKGAAVAGLSCTDAERAAGTCRSNLDGDHNDMKYRPCEVSQAWSRLMKIAPMDDLFRESGPGG